ncbi:glycosyltransferase [Phenylobacterium sp.]|uniref:glycosyltransferase n=1 Tax=Phenylobacterium sp. TaxID=1871053 RepID=UPI0035B2837E
MSPLSVAYFVHDVWDASVAKRVHMLLAGGARVDVAGFRRRAQVRGQVDGAPVLDLGRTADAALAKRAGLVVWRALTAPIWARRFKNDEVFVARSLELLTLAWAAKVALGGRRALVYECVDIHRLLLSDGLAGRVLRAWERFLLKRSDLVITTSPAFVSQYLAARQGLSAPHLLVENKPLAPAEPPPPRPPAGPPWRIGWFGMIRCARSLRILCELADALGPRVEVLIAGRVAETEIADMQGVLAAHPGVTFVGPYGPEDLGRLYGQVHFTWAIDFFEEGLNSSWLLPNRLYEGGAFGAPPLALASVETGRWLEKRGAGVLLPDDVLPALKTFFAELTPDAYVRQTAALQAIPRDQLVAGQADADGLVEALGQINAGCETP